MSVFVALSAVKAGSLGGQKEGNRLAAAKKRPKMVESEKSENERTHRTHRLFPPFPAPRSRASRATPSAPRTAAARPGALRAMVPAIRVHSSRPWAG